jgi:hypothetical protein
MKQLPHDYYREILLSLVSKCRGFTYTNAFTILCLVSKSVWQPKNDNDYNILMVGHYWTIYIIMFMCLNVNIDCDAVWSLYVNFIFWGLVFAWHLYQFWSFQEKQETGIPLQTQIRQIIHKVCVCKTLLPLLVCKNYKIQLPVILWFFDENQNLRTSIMHTSSMCTNILQNFTALTQKL